MNCGDIVIIHQVSKITRNARISLGDVMKAMHLQEGDYIQIFSEDGKVCLSKVEPLPPKAEA